MRVAVSEAKLWLHLEFLLWNKSSDLAGVEAKFSKHNLLRQKPSYLKRIRPVKPT